MDQIQPVVNEPLTPAQPSEGAPPEATPEEVPQPAPIPGSKTDPNLLLKSLQEERDKRKLLEEELETIKSSALSENEVMSDEGKALKQQIDSLNEKISQIEEEKELNKVYGQFPDMKGLSSEFEEFRKDYPKHKLENVAKIFRAEKGLLETPRRGLENPGGGPRIPLTSGMTAEDVRILRETNFKKYTDMLLKGQIKVE